LQERQSDSRNRDSRQGVEKAEDVGNVVANLRERLYDRRSVGWRPLLERYIKGEYGLHIHLNHQRVGIRSSDSFDSTYLCATFEWPRGFLLKDSELEFWTLALNVMEPNVEERGMKVAVLVNVPEFVQNRKRLFSRILPCNKRLQSLELCAQTWPDSPEALKVFGTGPGDEVSEMVRGMRLNVNRETDVSPLAPQPTFRNRIWGRRVPLRDSELPNEMVERGTEIVNDVPDDRTPFVYGWLPEDLTVDGYLACLGIRLSVKFVRATIVNERLDPLVQEVQMHVRSLDFRPTAF
jgi:hypothetical protein